MKARASGFTLVEIMIALAILSIGLVSLYAAQGNSLRASGQAEQVQTASLLARQLMTSKMLEIEQGMEKGSFPEDKTEETGEFDAPFDRYRWEFVVRKVEIPLAGQPEVPEEGAGSANQAPASAQQSLAQMVTKKISENVREITLKVIWEDLGEEQSISITTHVARLQ